MNCKSVQNRLSAYLDRELGGDELLQMRAHISVCRECRSEVEGLRTLKALLGGIQCPEPPEDLAERLTANMLRQRYEEPRKNFRATALVFAGFATCSMVATLLLLNFGFGRHDGQSTIGSGSRSGTVAMPDGPFGDFNSSAVISAANFGPR